MKKKNKRYGYVYNHPNRKKKKRRNYYGTASYGKKWTEEPQGRPIDFADKYIVSGSYYDKFDYKREKPKKKRMTPESRRKWLQNLIIAVCVIVLVGTGYTVMDLYMLRVSPPADTAVESVGAGSTAGVPAPGRAAVASAGDLDGADRVAALAAQCAESSCTTVLAELKRADGTLGYQSRLDQVAQAGAVSAPAPDLSGSVAALQESGVVLAAHIFCFQDSLAAAAMPDAALHSTQGTLFADSAGSMYLDPQSTDAYNYIKNIIEEIAQSGVRAFVLDGCTFPAGTVYYGQDVYAELKERLQNDLGSACTFYRAVPAASAEALDNSVSDAFYIIGASDTQTAEAAQARTGIRWAVSGTQ